MALDQDEEVLGFCLNVQCKKESAFCYLCPHTAFHQSHLKDCLRFKEMKQILEFIDLKIGKIELFFSDSKNKWSQTFAQNNLQKNQFLLAKTSSNQIYFSLEKKIVFEEAINNYSKAIKFDQNDAQAFNSKGNSLSKQIYGNNIQQQLYEEAIQNYDRAIQLNSNYSVYFRNKSKNNLYIMEHIMSMFIFFKQIILCLISMIIVQFKILFRYLVIVLIMQQKDSEVYLFDKVTIHNQYSKFYKKFSNGYDSLEISQINERFFNFFLSNNIELDKVSQFVVEQKKLQEKNYKITMIMQIKKKLPSLYNYLFKMQKGKKFGQVKLCNICQNSQNYNLSLNCFRAVNQIIYSARLIQTIVAYEELIITITESSFTIQQVQLI